MYERSTELPDLPAIMNPAARRLLGKDRLTSETRYGSDEAMDSAQFRNVVGFLDRPTTIDRRVDAMGQQQPNLPRSPPACKLAGLGVR